MRVAFLADTGSGNQANGVRRLDWYGNEENVYDINGEPCVDYKGEQCMLKSQATEVFKMVKDSGVHLVVHGKSVVISSIHHAYMRDMSKEQNYRYTEHSIYHTRL